MNFSTHVQNLITSISQCLTQDKAGIVYGFRPILSKANSLYKTNRFDFWLRQIGQTNLDEIPMTKFGVNEAKSSCLSLVKQLGQNNIEDTIDYICEDIFTYCRDDDMCNMQGIFHYYYHLLAGIVFKESELGSSTLGAFESKRDEIRIAWVSELSIYPQELLP